MQTPEQVREHYEIETALASKLKSSTREQRKTLYTEVYMELLTRVTHHPRFLRRKENSSPDLALLTFIERQCPKGGTFLEVGPGECAISMAMCAHAGTVCAVDVSTEHTSAYINPPKNFSLVLSDGCSVPVMPGSVDFAFSNQLMEHLHPDDAVTQLQGIYTALKVGGAYYVVTPSRANGPHDVSRGFDAVATGLHLKEYLIGELIDLCRTVGFTRFEAYAVRRGQHYRIPIGLVRLTERLAPILPSKLHALLGIHLIARK